MVEFLVEHGADVNKGDNEGWTPLHATASCGFLYIAKYLIEKGANVAAVNNDGELAVDIAECQKMEDLLNEEIKKRGSYCWQIWDTICDQVLFRNRLRRRTERRETYNAPRC